jgi:hypothetical protein
MPLLELISLRIPWVYGKQETTNNFMDGANLSIYMKALLGITDLLEAGNHTEEDLQRAAIRSLYFFSKPNFFYSLRRTEDLFLHIPTELVTHHHLLMDNRNDRWRRIMLAAHVMKRSDDCSVCAKRQT